MRQSAYLSYLSRAFQEAALLCRRAVAMNPRAPWFLRAPMQSEFVRIPLNRIRYSLVWEDYRTLMARPAARPR